MLFLAAARTQEQGGGKEDVSPDLQELKPLKLKECFPAMLGSWGQGLFKCKVNSTLPNKLKKFT